MVVRAEPGCCSLQTHTHHDTTVQQTHGGDGAQWQSFRSCTLCTVPQHGAAPGPGTRRGTGRKRLEGQGRRGSQASQPRDKKQNQRLLHTTRATPDHSFIFPRHYLYPLPRSRLPSAPRSQTLTTSPAAGFHLSLSLSLFSTALPRHAKSGAVADLAYVSKPRSSSSSPAGMDMSLSSSSPPSSAAPPPCQWAGAGLGSAACGGCSAPSPPASSRPVRVGVVNQARVVRRGGCM